MIRKSLLGLYLSFSAAAGAQEASLELPPVVVTASRTPTGLERTGSSVSVITRRDIERRQAVTIADLMRNVPGVAVSRSGNLGARTQLRVRGSEANHVLVMIDGVEANDPTAGDEFLFEHLTADDIERVEVVRGPQSALWGSDAVGGVVNIVTRTADRAGSSAFVETGRFGTTRLGGGLGAAADGRGLRVGASYLNTDGSNISRSGDERDGYRNGSLSLSGRWETAPLRVTLSARRIEASKAFDGIDTAETGLPVDADLENDTAHTYANLTASFVPAGAWSHRLKLTYLGSDSDELDGGTVASTLAADKLGFYYQGTADLGPRRAGAVTLAIDHEREDFMQRAAASPFGNPNQTQHIESTGYVLEYRLSPLDGLDLSVAARRDVNSDFADVTTYRLTGAYSLDGRTRLHASLGTGQKAPTLIERFGFFPDSFLGNEDLRPEQSRGWDLGAERSVLDERLTLGATLFDEKLTDEIDGFVFDPATLLFTATNRNGISRRRGIELAASGDPTERLSVSLSATFLDSTEPDSSGRSVTEIRRPERLAALNLNYAPSDRVNLNLNVAYNGSHDDTYFPPFPRPAERVELPAYTLVTLAASFGINDRLELTGRIDNLLDEDYEDVLGFATPGAAVYVGFRTRR